MFISVTHQEGDFEISFSSMFKFGVIREVYRRAEVSKPTHHLRTEFYARIMAELGRPLVLLDIGARFGLSPHWTEAVNSGLVQAYALEPDESECQRLRALGGPVRFLPFAVGNEKGRVKFHITRHPGASSVREPNMEVLKEFPVREYFEVDRVTEVDLTTIDGLVSSGQLPQPDFI